MHSDIIAKIDALVKMSDSSANVGTLKVELREIECSIKEKKLDLKELKSSMTDDKYFDASGEIVDKNIEISLGKKIKLLKKSMEELNVQLRELEQDEEKLHTEVESLITSISDSENFIQVLNIKISSANSEEKSDFKSLLKECESKLKESKKELDKVQKKYEKVQGKLEVLVFSKKELDNKIESETEKLMDVKANLLNKRGYVNSELKNEDEERVKELENEIDKLEAEKTRILNEPVMMAEEAKNYLIDDDKTSAIKKIKELKELLVLQPYMDIDTVYSEETLAIELENAEAKRDEFASMINSKNYESVDTTLTKDRIAYITDKKEKLISKIEDVKKEIKRLDTVELEDLNNRINYCENEVLNLKDKIAEYEETLKDSDLTITKKASLQASFDKKEEELKNVMALLASYKNDRKNVILQSYKLDTEKISSINEEIDEINKELKCLEKLCVSSNKAKDIMAIENDKKTLKDLNDVVKAIKKRQGLKITPSEIYEDIEFMLGTSDVYLDEKDEEPVEDLSSEFEPVDIDTEIAVEENEDIDVTPVLDLEEIILNDDENVELVEEVEDIPKIEPIQFDEDSEGLKILTDEDLTLEMTDVNEEKIKVVSIENLDNVESGDETTNEENEFLIGDYKIEEL